MNTSNKLGVLGTATTRIISPIDGSHWLTLDHVFQEATAVGMSAARSDQDYSSKNYFDIWREIQEFRRQNISMSRPILDLTPIYTNMKNVATSQMDSTPIGTNSRPHAIDTTNGIIKTKGKSARTRGPGVRPIIVIIISKQI